MPLWQLPPVCGGGEPLHLLETAVEGLDPFETAPIGNCFVQHFAFGDEGAGLRNALLDDELMRGQPEELPEELTKSAVTQLTGSGDCMVIEIAGRTEHPGHGE